jgi:hypothetical protein
VVAGLQYGMAHTAAVNLSPENGGCKGTDTKAKSDCQQVPCPSGYECHWQAIDAPECRPLCPPGSGQTKCGDTCVDLQTDNDNCGSCGHVCVGSSSCTNGHCECNTCGNQGRNSMSQICDGQCIDTSSDPTNCGSCGNVCPDTVNGFRGICNCGQCDGCSGGVGSFWCCQTSKCTHACPPPGETCP